MSADVVAINQPIVYNRFGSMNPWGMVYALRGDLADANAAPGEARLKPDRRPRPLVLRVAVGDELRIHFQNLLADVQTVDGVAICEVADDNSVQNERDRRHFTVPEPPNDPCTRNAGIAVVGLTPEDGSDPLRTGLQSLAPGERITYRYRAQRAGSYFFSSLGAVAGGQGDGGSLTHGLFGMVIVEPEGSRFYRSQVSQADMDCARDPATGGDGCQSNPGSAWLDYEASRDGKPLLNMLRANAEGGMEIVHGDLTAVVVQDKPAAEVRLGESNVDAWREFAIVFHDELKTVHAPEFDILNEPGPGASEAAKARHQQMVGTRDGYGINYGVGGMGTMVIANRIGMGPARDCVTCSYEEFFLSSWANGDPALLAQYADDPSNVYHSYLGDRVKFHNVHAGPKETHVFHLHAHQWLSQHGNDGGAPGKTARGEYLDSQTIAPFQSFDYEIFHGGSGNRNLSPGDSIFHCHLYPHFAQGMWGMWRVHDVLEDGARKLPDPGGVWHFRDGRGWGYEQTAWAGPGTDRNTGEHHAGTPIPALVPLPGQALPPYPTYAQSQRPQLPGGGIAPVMPGYPFYIPGQAGYRAPQAPKDLEQDAGLPRHLALSPDGCVHGQINDCARTVPALTDALDAGDMTFAINTLKVLVLPDAGDDFEREAMNFHAGRPSGVDPWDPAVAGAKWQPSRLVEGYRDGVAAHFNVNGLHAAPGAPFANPCPDDSDPTVFRVSAVQLELVVNQFGWHDKQARINVLTREAEDYEGQRRSASPFFFRARSGDCIVFHHQNRTPAHTTKDAFQVAAPTDIIGQHIHLVKFDVTASDGSANGYNYEDGTLALEHIKHTIHATHVPGGKAVDTAGNPVDLQLKLDAQGKPLYQTTTQRWWADPLMDEASLDRTVGTVFTHDHFGASNIQQHGFYSALLVQPAGSEWFHPDGRPMEPEGVGTQAIIRVPAAAARASSEHLRGSYREFALAVADFALLHDDQDRPIAPPHGRLDRPEALSVDHHDPYLFNYRNEPLPMRIGRVDRSGSWRIHDQRPVDEMQPGDMAFVFDSETHADNPNSTNDPKVLGNHFFSNHAPGDPSTEIFEAYEGDRVHLRLIQGAQEVQHVFTLHGQKWQRQNAVSNATWVGSQEIGISEHFEMVVQSQPSVLGAEHLVTNDFLYHAGTVDALWNGAWGLMRTYAAPSTLDPSRNTGPEAEIRCRLAAVDGKRGKEVDEDCGGTVPAIAANDFRNPTDFTGLGPANEFRPPVVTARVFCIDAISRPLTYRDASGEVEAIGDPHAMQFTLRKTGVVELDGDSDNPICNDPEIHPVAGREDHPLVLRMRSGEMAYIEVANRLGPQAPTSGNAVLPPIVSPAGGDIAGINNMLTPSQRVGLHASLVAYQVNQSDGTNVGLNAPAGANPSVVEPGEPATAMWYAGVVESRRIGDDLHFDWKPFVTERGMVATLSSMVDPIRHPTAGLVGALVIEPEHADLDGALISDDGMSARICLKGGIDCWDEFVLVYQDGLNLKQQEGGAWKAIPDCASCDDSYDSGDLAVNYRTEPFWARLGLPRWDRDSATDSDSPDARLPDLNATAIPADFLLPQHHPIATPIFCSTPGARVVVHALHPGGRARQRTLISYGNRYDDLGLPGFGSPSSTLLAPQKAATMDLGRIADGLWLYRDGTAHMMASGVWGYIDARSDRTEDECAPLARSP